jgi:hypothetical protein
MVEHAEALTHSVRRMPDQERKELAIKFLDLFHSLDSIYLINEKSMSSTSNKTSVSSIPIQMCDVKLDNFGLNEKKDLKIIDTDMAHADFYLFNKKVCNSHEDCHYFDCKSYCDPNTKHCIGFRVNNNLQSLCEKIFNNTFLREDGLLSGISDFGSNIEHEIKGRLNVCISPGFYKETSVVKNADTKLLNVFRELLNDRGMNKN